jgi:hypothetical protein
MAAPLKGNHAFASIACKIAAHELRQRLMKLGPLTLDKTSVTLPRVCKRATDKKRTAPCCSSVRRRRSKLASTGPEVAQIENWRRAQPEIPQLAEALRQLVKLGLEVSASEGKGKHRLASKADAAAAE